LTARGRGISIKGKYYPWIYSLSIHKGDLFSGTLETEGWEASHEMYQLFLKEVNTKWIASLKSGFDIEFNNCGMAYFESGHSTHVLLNIHGLFRNGTKRLIDV